MSDYMFMLDSHLSAGQSRALQCVQNAAATANLSLFLTGGALRDMFGGFAIRDLDFTVEGSPTKLAKAVAETSGAAITATDDHRKSIEMVFPDGVPVSLAMAREEKYSRPGVRPKVTASTIYEDLRRRDFTINAMALSLNRASRGLVIDPTNGRGDLESRELRVAAPYALYDDPSRVLRLYRLKARLGFNVAPRTASQCQTVREEELHLKIDPEQIRAELLAAAREPDPAEVVRLLAEEGLTQLFSPALTGSGLNIPGLIRLHKAMAQIPFGLPFRPDQESLFLHVLTGNLSAAQRTAMAKTLSLPAPLVKAWTGFEAASKKLEKQLQNPKLQKPSLLYEAISSAPAELIADLMMRSAQRLVQDRIRNYFQKHLPAALEVTDEEVQAKGFVPGTPKFAKARKELVATRLDSRPKKPAVEPEAVAEAAPAGKK